MYKIKKQLRLSFAMLILLSAVSCDYLEYNDEMVNTDEIVWTDVSNIKNSIGAVYAQLPNGYKQIDGGFMACATDEAESANTSSSVEYFNNGSWNMFKNPDNQWNKNYTGIYRANRFIESADTVTLAPMKWDADNWPENIALVRAFRGEARFLRAFFYFELIKRYGGVPIIESSDEIDYLNPGQFPRDSYDDCLNYITSQCDSAIHYMRERIPSNLRGFADDGAALALKTRAFLYGASALNNTDGVYDAYYDSCAVNASRLFSMGYNVSGVNYEKLFTPTDGLHDINNDVIFDVRQGNTKSYEIDNYPVGFENAKGYTNPTQDLVDAYEMKDGSVFDWNDPVMAADPYANRDARFYASILYNGVPMLGRNVECYNGGIDGPVQSDIIGTRTGYYLKKYIRTDVDLITGGNQKHFWFLFRYAEVLLNYAEAMNELYGPDADPNGYGKTALEAINEVRARAGQPALTTNDQDEFREKVRHERRIELAFEDHRFWDVRRWKIAEETIGEPIHGVDIEKEVNGEEVSYKYTVKEVENRVFEEKMYLYPIPSSEILNDTGITQNPGW
ncbi:RagB/SusD family nutrient uptake outer membrane protein [Puteibacter caeruleilacunae]|nr:RagB/SusD family nutrient uptake outer membrane protein [Puteibacter caeruleilacunae]